MLSNLGHCSQNSTGTLKAVWSSVGRKTGSEACGLSVPCLRGGGSFAVNRYRSQYLNSDHPFRVREPVTGLFPASAILFDSPPFSVGGRGGDVGKIPQRRRMMYSPNHSILMLESTSGPPGCHSLKRSSVVRLTPVFPRTPASRVLSSSVPIPKSYSAYCSQFASARTALAAAPASPFGRPQRPLGGPSDHGE